MNMPEIPEALVAIADADKKLRAALTALAHAQGRIEAAEREVRECRDTLVTALAEGNAWLDQVAELARFGKPA